MKLLLKLSDVVEGDGTVIGDTTAGGGMDEARVDMDHVEEVISAQ